MSQKFRLVSWNIERGIKFNNILDILAEQIPADIYALQEVDIHAYRSKYKDEAADLAAELKMNYAYGIEFREFSQEKSGISAFHGQAFISKIPLQSSRVFYFPHQFRDWALKWYHRPLILSKLPRLQTWLIQHVGSVELGFPVAHLFQPRRGGRMALVGEFAVGKKKLWIYNAHLESHATDAQKVFQVEDILKDASLKIGRKDAVVILGDLNTELGGRSPILKAIKKQGFKNVLADFKSQQIATCQNRKLDWIFVKNLKVLKAWILRDAYMASDHRPILAELELL